MQRLMNAELQAKKFTHMTTDPIERLVCRMAVPSVISMLISAFYNLADTFFIGKISTEATAAIGVVFAYMVLIQAVAFFFGHGSGNYISRALGRRNTEDAEKMAATGFFSALFFGAALILPGLLLMESFLRLLGATDTILPEAKNYFLYILLSTPFLMGALVLNNQMRLQGNARLGMIGITAGALLNVVLDPLLIFVCDMGVGGASLATGISQTVSFLLLLWLSGRGDGIRVRLRAFSPSLHAYREILAGGLPSLGRQGLASVATLCLNHAAGVYGDAAIAAFSVVSRIAVIASSALIGFGQGFQPVCGFNYGAGLYGRVRQAFWFCVKLGTVLLTVLAVLEFAFAEPLIRLFRADDPELLRIGATALRYQSVVFPLLGYITVTNMYLQTIRRTIPATVTAMARQGLVFLPVLLIASSVGGLTGIELAQPIADILTFLLSLPLGLANLHHMENESANTVL